MNPNSSSRRSVTKPQWVINSSSKWHLSSGSSSGPSSRQVESICTEPVKLTEEELLICCPTVPGFSLGIKLWGKIPVFKD